MDLQALKSTLEQISDKKPDQIVFLGDIFQRGNEEIECLESLKNEKTPGAVKLRWLRDWGWSRSTTWIKKR